MRILVIGSGIAGLSFALRVADLGEVIVITKKGVADSATNLAQGGIAAVLDREVDSIESHITDTLTAGAGLCDEQIVSMVVERAPATIQQLAEWGVQFDAEDNHYHLTREGGHSRRRIMHAGGDATGAEVQRALDHAAATLDVRRWNHTRDKATARALKARAKSDPIFGKILRETHKRRLYLLHFERGGEKSYWGGSIRKDTGQLVGNNRLGKLLMTLRKMMVEADEE